MRRVLLLLLTSCAVAVNDPAATLTGDLCDDGNPCTADRWSRSGCEHEALPGGASCEADGCAGRCYPPLIGADGSALEAGECDCLGR